MTNLTTKIAGVTFKNPVIAASGVYGFGSDYSDLLPLSELGGISCKGLTLEKRDGNLSPRISETPSGMLNSVGLQNPGVDMFIDGFLPELTKSDTVIIVNIAGNTVEDYANMAKKLDKTAVSMIEVNISCPNVKQGGAAFGITTEGAAAVTKAVRAATTKPIMIKLTPNVTNIVDIAKAVEAAGADAVSLINTLLGMRIDIKTRRPILRNNVGGLSGAAIFPVALRDVWAVANAIKLDVVGVGGITSGALAVEMCMAGAKAVEIGTAILTDPYAPVKIIKGIEAYLNEYKIANFVDICGSVMPY